MPQHGSKYFAPETPLRHPHDPWSKVKLQLFQNLVMLHVKFNGITNATTILPTDPPHSTLGVKILFFSEHGHVAYKLKESQMPQHGSKYFAHRPP